MNIDRFIKKRGSFILLAICIIAFWQIVFLQNGMKWDFVDAYLPARYFFSEAVLNNIFPFWNPYMLYGVPFYADLVSVFNPGFWIVANMFGYSNITLQFVFVTCVFIAGVNFRYFLQKFAVGEPVAISFAIAYMLSGFTVGNAQHLGFITGYALMPLVIASYLQFLWQLKVKSLVRFSLVFLLMVFAGYPGLTIIVAYLLLGIFIYYLVLSIKRKKATRRFLLFHLILAGIVLIGSSVLLLAYFQAQPFLSRYSGLSLGAVLRHPFTLRSFWSFLFPMCTSTDVDFFNTDPSMSNGYFGVFGFLLFVFAMTVKAKQKVSLLFLFSAVFALLAALGNRFFLREFLYNYFPFMNMFKYPSIFRAVSIFGFLAFAGLNCNFDRFAFGHKKKLWTVVGLVMTFILLVIIRSAGRLDSFSFLDLSSADRLQNIKIDEAFVLQGIIQLFLLGSFFLVINLNRKQKNLTWIIVLLFAIDGIVSTQLNIRYTVISNINPVEFKAYLDSKPKGFIIPGLHPIGEYSDKNASGKFTWRNNNVFPKRVTYDGLVSFKTDGYSTLDEEFPELLVAMKKQPLFFFSDDVRASRDTANTGDKTVFLAPAAMQTIEGKRLQSHQSDKLKITGFSPTNISLQTVTKNNQLLVFQQNYYSGWQVIIDGKKQKVVNVNYAFMATLVPGGEHHIQFRYRNNLVIMFFVLSMLLLMVLTTLLLFMHYRNKPESRQTIIWSGLGFIILFIAFSAANRYRYQKNKNALLPEIRHEFAKLKSHNGTEVTTFLSYASATEFNLPGADYQFYLDENINVAAFGEVLAKTQTPQFALGWVNGAISSEVRELFISYFPDVEKEQLAKNSGFLLAGKNGSTAYRFVEDFEGQAKSVWSVDKNRVKKDSIFANSYYTFMPDEKWGASLQVTIDEHCLGTKEISILGDLRFPEVFSEVNMVISVLRDKEQIDYYAREISDFTYSVGNWSRFVVVRPFDFDLNVGDVVHIYLWNRTQARFDIDNLKVKMYCSK